MRKAETLPEVEAELAQRIAALTKVLLWNNWSAYILTETTGNQNAISKCFL
jgi:hypothetical protein